MARMRQNKIEWAETSSNGPEWAGLGPNGPGQDQMSMSQENLKMSWDTYGSNEPKWDQMVRQTRSSLIQLEMPNGNHARAKM